VVLVYKKAGYDYIFEKEETFVVGNKSEIQLSRNQNYTLVIVSTGTSVPPKISEKVSFTDARFMPYNTVDLHTRFLYQRIDNFIPNGDINHDLIDIKLKNKTSSVNISLDSSDFMGGDQGGKRIVSIRNPRLIYNRPVNVEVRISDSEQILSNRSKETTTDVEFPGSVSTFIVSDFANNLVFNSNTDVFFAADISIEGLLDIKTIKFSLKGVKLGYRQEYNIKLARCGAYLGPNNTEWRQFMCHNLGADYDRDPFTPNENIHGDKYQWGYSYPIVKQRDDVYERDAVPGWNQVRKDNTWNKGIDDPCPSGYRLPTKDEAESLIKHNSVTKLGPWSADGSVPIRNANAGALLGSYLMLPAAGKIFSYGNISSGHDMILYYGTTVEYWTSTPSGVDTLPGDDTYHGDAFTFGIYARYNTKGEILNRWNTDSTPLRCIKKLPNE